MSAKTFMRYALQLLAWGLFAVGLYCVGALSLMIWKGGVWARVIYLALPIPHLLTGAAAFLGWHILRRLPRYTWRDWLTFTARLLLLTVSLAISLALGEIAIRALLIAKQNANSIERFRKLKAQGKKMPIRSSHPLAVIIQCSDNPRLVYELQPGLNMKFGHRQTRTNKAGMRSDYDYAFEHPSNGVRIVGVGDSGMFGWGVEQGEEYLAVLASNLNARADGRRYEALNFAVPGYNTQLEVETLRSKGLTYHPDIVIVGWCDNDFGLPFFMWERQNFKRRDMSYLYAFLFRRDKINTDLILNDQRVYTHEQVIPELTSGTHTKGVKRALQELQELGRQAGFKVLVFGPMQREARQICAEIGMPYYNTHEKIPRGAYPASYDIHFMHPRAPGHRVLAEHLEQEFVARGWLPPRGG
jgi:lysophospholipase L1-like esterase